MGELVFVILIVVGFGAGIYCLWPALGAQRRPSPASPAAGRAAVEAADADDRSRPQYRPYAPPPPAPARPLSDDGDLSPPADLAGARTFERVSATLALLDISPDGAEAMALHDGNCVTVFDVASGRALQTWRDVAPVEWLSDLGEVASFSCAGRRLLLGWSKTGPNEDGCENVLIDLEALTATRVYEADDGQDALQTVTMSADGRFAAGFVTYGKSHAAFELDAPLQTTTEEQKWGQFGDILLAPGTIWPETAMSDDGRWFAVDRGDGDVLALALEPEPEDRDELPTWHWPSYEAHMVVVGDDAPALLDFSPDSDRLLVLDVAGGLAVADMAAQDFRLLQPFPEASDGDRHVFLGLTWLAGRDQAIVKILKPTPRLVLVDLADGAVVREWPVVEETVRRLWVARTGAFALVGGDDGALRVLPLLDDDD